MILHGNQRGGGRDLAIHLMKPENERVEIIEMRGFASDNLMGAFIESHAISKGTRCTQHLYSLSINPPADAAIDSPDYIDAADRVEKELGLTNQPRAIVRHWKCGDDGVLRQHAHAVWCRIDIDNMRAVHLPFTKKRLREVSKELHRQHGLKMPPGLINSKDRAPRNFTLEQWQQCKRAKKDVREIKSDISDAWSISDARAAFAHALEERGYVLAKGNRGYVAVDHKGECYAVRTYAGLKSKEIQAKLGAPDNLPTVGAAQAKAAARVIERLKELRIEQHTEISLKRFYEKAEQARQQNKLSRDLSNFREKQGRQAQIEEQKRQSRLRSRLPGLWDWLTGKRKRALALNEREAHSSKKLQRQELRAIRDRQLAAIKSQQEQVRAARLKHFEAIKELRSDMHRLKEPPDMVRSKPNRRPASERPRRRSRSRDGPELGR
ncbi:MAG: relaxase/mobilization nuclease domain-containing protein [Alphaproteobacteria bacterium]